MIRPRVEALGGIGLGLGVHGLIKIAQSAHAGFESKRGFL